MAQGRLTPKLVRRFQHSGHERVLEVIKVRTLFYHTSAAYVKQALSLSGSCSHFACSW